MGDLEPFSLGRVYTMLELRQEQIRLSFHSYVKYFYAGIATCHSYVKFSAIAKRPTF